MLKNPASFLLAIMIVSVLLAGCNFPSETATPQAAATAAASTLAAEQTDVAASLTAQAAIPTPTESPAVMSTPALTATPQSPLVVRDTLCWVGPGNQFEVVSAVRTGTSVQLIGQGTISGWFIIKNPIYHDPCWIQASDLQIPAGLDFSSLPYFNPPDTPTPKPSKTPIPSSTPTP